MPLRCGQLDQDRRQQPLALDPSGRQSLHRLLEQHALVRDVLIDDGDAFIVYGDDEGVAKLSEGNHRTEVRRIRRIDAGRGCRTENTIEPLHAGHAREGGLRTPAVPDGRSRENARNGHRPRLISHGYLRRQLQFGRGPLAERIGQRPPQHFVNERLLQKADFRLGRMHVDVDTVRGHVDEEVDLRAALLDGGNAVGIDDRVGDRAVLDDSAVHEDVLRAAHGSLIAQGRHVAR